MKKKWLIAALSVLMLLTACAAAPQSETSQAPTETTVPTEPTRPVEETNIMRWDGILDGVSMNGEYPVFGYGTGYRREQIRSITFLDTLVDAPEDAWDVSEEKNGAVLAWVEPSGELFDLYIGAEGGVWAGKSCRNLFQGYTHAERIEFGDAFHTGNVRDMSGMFLWCESVRELDLSGFDTSQVTDMTSMFAVCHALEKVDLSSFNTARVKLMGGMFDWCDSLLELDLSNFNTVNVINMGNMFSECASLTRLDLGSFHTPNLTYTSRMFTGCRALTELDISGLDTSKVTSTSYMFMDCESLTELDLSHFDMSSVSGDYCTYKMFYNCPAGREWKHLEK